MLRMINDGATFYVVFVINKKKNFKEREKNLLFSVLFYLFLSFL